MLASGLPLTTGENGLGVLDIGSTAIKLASTFKTVEIGKTGNPIEKVIPAIKEMNLTKEEGDSFINQLLANINYLRLTDSNLEKVKTKGSGLYYPEEDLINQVKYEITKIRDVSDPHDHDYAILVKEDPDRGTHNLVCMPEVALVNSEYKVIERLKQGITSYEDALVNESELRMLKHYYSLLRVIMAGYISPAYSIADTIRSFLRAI
jgi:hypothetical protein